MAKKKTREEMATEIDRLRGLFETWEPVGVAENLRRELARLKAEQAERDVAKLNAAADILENVAIEFGKELRAYRNFQARADAGIAGKAKRLYRHLCRFMPTPKTEG